MFNTTYRSDPKTEPQTGLQTDIEDAEHAIQQNIEEIEVRLSWLKRDLKNYQELRKLL